MSLLTESTVVDFIEVIENGSLQVRTATVIKRDGVEVIRTFHRHVVAPGDDTTNEDGRVQDIAAAVHTPAVISAYQAQQAANNAA